MALMRVKAVAARLGHHWRMKLRLSFLLVLTAALADFLVARAGAADQVFAATGVIRAPLDGDRIVIAHEDIPGFMPAMTMAFPVTHPAEAKALKVGDSVRFRLRVSETAASVEGFEVFGADVERAEAGSPRHPILRSHHLREGDALPDFSLVDETGAPLTAASLRGQFTVVTFIFTRCPVPEYCPAMALRFGELQKRILTDPQLAARVRLLSISFDPEFDRPEILKAYATAVGADPAAWHFATGEKSQVEALTKAFAVFVERNDVTLNHTLCTALVGPDGRIVSLWRGNGWRAGDVLRAVNAEN